MLGLDAPGLDLTATEHLRRHGVRAVAVVPGRGRRRRPRGCAPSRIGLQVLVDESDLRLAASRRHRGGRAPAPDAAPRGPASGADRGRRPDGRCTERAGPAGRVIAVWGPAGAPGRTTLAAGLAAELARRRLRDAAGRRGSLRGCRRPAAGGARRGVRPARRGPAGRLRTAGGAASPRCSAASTADLSRDHRAAAARPLDRGPRRRPGARPGDRARARAGRRRHRLQPRGGPGRRLRVPPRPQPHDAGGAGGRRRGRGGRQRRPGRAVPSRPRPGRAARRRRPARRSGWS